MDKNLRLKVILDGLDKLTSPLKSITGASSAARRDLAKTRDELKSLDALQQQVGKYKVAEGRYAADHRALQESSARLEELRAKLNAAEQPTKKLRTEFEKAERQTAQLNTRLDAGGNELRDLSAKLSKAGIDVADLANHEDRLALKTYEANKVLRQQTEQLERAGRASRNTQQLNDLSAKATGAGLGMIGAGTAAGAPIMMASKEAMSLESQMADVRKVTDMTRPEIQRLSDDFLDLSEKIPLSAQELATIAAAAGAAGVGMDKFGKPMADQRNQLLEFTNAAGEMGVAFDMTADQAGDTMAKWRTAFDLPQDGVRSLGDRINALTNTFGGKAVNVADIVTRIGSLGGVAGLAAPQIAALGSTLDSIGVPSEVAATGIKNTMLALTKGEEATKGQQAAFRKLGLEAGAVSRAMQVDASGTIVDVMERISKLDPSEQAGLLTKLFGSESVAAIAPMLTNLDGLKSRLSLISDESAVAGSMHAEFLNRIATTEGATGLASNALQNLNIKLGEYLLPTIKEGAEWIKGIAQDIRGWAEEHPKLAKGIMIFMAAGSALLILLGTLSLAFAALFFAAAPLGIALLPLLAIVAAIALVAAAAYMIYDNWGAISDWFADLWQTIKNYTSAAIRALIDVFLRFSPVGIIIRKFAPVLDYLRKLDFAQIGRDMIQGLINGVTNKFNALKATMSAIGNMIPQPIRKALDIHSPSRVFAAIGGHVMDGLDQGLANGSAAPIERISSLSARMAGAMALGASGAAMAVSVPGAARDAGGAGRTASLAPVEYHLNFYGVTGDPTDIAEAVRKAIEDLERERRGRTFGDD